MKGARKEPDGAVALYARGVFVAVLTGDRIPDALGWVPEDLDLAFAAIVASSDVEESSRESTRELYGVSSRGAIRQNARDGAQRWRTAR